MGRSGGNIGGSGSRSSGTGGNRSSPGLSSGNRSSSINSGHRSSPSSLSSFGSSRGGLNNNNTNNTRPNISNSPRQSTPPRPYTSSPSFHTHNPPPRSYTSPHPAQSSRSHISPPPSARTTTVVHNHFSRDTSYSIPRSGMSYYGSTAQVHSKRRGVSVGGIIATIVVLLIVALIFSIIISNTGSSLMGVPASTLNRVALNAGEAKGDTLIYEDATGDGDWFPDAYKMENGANTAYNLTGVKFGVYVTRSIDGDSDPSNDKMQAFATNLYNKWFPDDAAHLLLLVIDQPQFDGYSFYIETGYSAQKVFDNESGDILDAYLYSHWFNQNNTASEVFGKTFSDTAKHIMTITPTFTQVIVPWIAGIVIFAIILFAINFLIKSSAKRKEAAAAKAQADAQLLATPLAGFDAPLDTDDPLLVQYLPDESPTYEPPENPLKDPYASRPQGFAKQQACQGFPQQPPQQFIIPPSDSPLG